MAETSLTSRIEEVEKPDVQGLVARGFGRLRAARYLLLTIVDPAAARAYLLGLLDAGKIASADDDPRDSTMQVALTWPGMIALGLPGAAAASFPRELKEGMGDPQRAEVLGDQNANAPASWEWGAPGKPPVHLMLMIYGKDDTVLDARVAAEKQAFDGAMQPAAEDRRTNWLEPDKEHFGFRDGISMAAPAGLRDEPSSKAKSTAPKRYVATGEFLLGYRNEYDHYSPSPVVAPADDPQHLLPETRDGAARDLGKNGTYLVYRQLAQHVGAFWEYMRRESREPAPTPAESAIALAAKMVGRWPDGRALVPLRRPDSHENDFDYWDEDREGTGCPFGSHIRRTNPRDQLPVDHGQGDSREMVAKHQILRRGRTYGDPLEKDLDIVKMMEMPDDGAPRGLHFICLVGHIHRQFEFMQNAWVKSPTFAGLTADADPLLGPRNTSPHPNPDDEFTCPADPVRRKYKRLPRFTTLVGGAYFFLPGLRALRYLATIGS